MSLTDDLEKQARKRRYVRSGKLQDWAKELKALADQLWNEDSENGWNVSYSTEPQLTARVTIDKVEFARFVRDEAGITGVFGAGKPVRFDNWQDAFDATVKRRIGREKL